MEPVVIQSNQYPDRISTDGIAPTLRNRAGTGGGNVPIVIVGLDLFCKPEEVCDDSVQQS